MSAWRSAFCDPKIVHVAQIYLASLAILTHIRILYLSLRGQCAGDAIGDIAEYELISTPRDRDQPSSISAFDGED